MAGLSGEHFEVAAVFEKGRVDEIGHNENTTMTDGSWMTSNKFKPDTTIAN
jgi:hypothetical protein